MIKTPKEKQDKFLDGDYFAFLCGADGGAVQEVKGQPIKNKFPNKRKDDKI